MDATVAFKDKSDNVSWLYIGALQRKAAIGKEKERIFLMLVARVKLVLSLVHGVAVAVHLSSGCSCSF